MTPATPNLTVYGPREGFIQSSSYSLDSRTPSYQNWNVNCVVLSESGLTSPRQVKVEHEQAICQVVHYSFHQVGRTGYAAIWFVCAKLPLADENPDATVIGALTVTITTTSGGTIPGSVQVAVD